MKKLLKSISHSVFGSVMVCLVACNQDEIKPICIEPPCGVIDETSTNLTLQIRGESVPSSAFVSIDDQEISLSLDGIDIEQGVVNSCWQTIPDITTESVVILVYELNGEPIVGILNPQFVRGNMVTIIIEGDGAIMKNYVECQDII